MKSFKLFVLLPIFLAGLAAPAMAQQNIAVINEQRVLRESVVGQHIRTRLEAIGAEVRAELTAIGQPIQQQTEALTTETASMTQQAITQRPDLMQRIEALNQQAQQFELERRRREQELAQTERQAMQPVYEALNPILEEVVASRGIDILVDRANLVFSSPDVDISDAVIALLNQRLPSVPVNRVRLPEGAPAAAQQ
ncbi:OmpH family outer membrane protein [Maricaulis sp.]|uniref:OmpH family outer membrane protein n=1 Tax=Maricaulis sp. TaxID=1486257 RepID=UPI003A906708